MNNLESKDLSVSMNLEFDYDSLKIIRDELHRRGLLVYKWNSKDIKDLDDNHLMNVYFYIARAINRRKDYEEYKEIIAENSENIY